jgi:hypothetical protein
MKRKPSINDAKTLKAWRARNKQKAWCHSVVNNAIRRGTLIRLPCTQCGNEKSHGHHEDYTKPLDVLWLCNLCHKQLHNQRSVRPKVQPKNRYLASMAHQEAQQRIALRQEEKQSNIHIARQLRNEGRTYKAIAENLRITKATAYKWLNDVAYK